MTEQERTEQQISYPAGQAGAPVAAGSCDEAGQAEAAVQASPAPESGTARARRILIAPLADLPRPRRTSKAAHREALDRLARKLSYMTEGGLRGLVEWCLVCAGQTRNTCPAPGLIEANAYRLETPPVQRSDYAASVMRSAMGRRAYDEGMGVELLRMAGRFGPPPNSYSIVQMREDAEQSRRRRALLRQTVEAGGRISAAAEAELKAWHDDAELVQALVAEGDERREARAAGEGEAA